MTRKLLGLPTDWNVVQKWYKKPFQFGYPMTSSSEKKESKYNDLDFSKKADKDFWDKFPSRKLPDKPTTKVKIDKLEKAVEAAAGKMTIHQRANAQRAIQNLKTGAPAYQLKPLPGANMRNASSTTKHGPMFTETLEKMIVEGYVAGPFNAPPLPEFRANSLMAIEQKDKIRPVLNLSYPKDKSFNDNVDKEAVPKVRMSSAKQFGQSVLQAGTGSLMSKMDLKDAYKHVPAKVQDFRLQGMQFLGAFFVDTQQIFGASTAVANFDNLADTVVTITLTKCSMPKGLVHRTLDDTACVAPVGSGLCEQFTKTYKETCQELGVKLAEDCPLAEKAFSNKTKGTVLGIQFDTNLQSWRISNQKAADILVDIHTIIHGGHVSLEQMETVAGRLTNFGQMCPFLQAFKRPLNDLLSSFKEDYDILLEVPDQLVRDLRVWAAVVTAANSWLPICLEMEDPPLGSLEFVSDAAGGHGTEEWLGVASLGTNQDGDVWFMCRGSWPPEIRTGKDEKGANFASKMTTLELVGLFLPLLSVPKSVQGRNLVLGVDNVSVVFGWENKSVKGDKSASALIRALHLLSCFLECRIFVRHVPRLTSRESFLADCLTRESTAKPEVWEALQGAEIHEPPAPLWDWLDHPSMDWDLGLTMIDWIKKNM